jgi:hypothetical protein
MNLLRPMGEKTGHPTGDNILLKQYQGNTQNACSQTWGCRSKPSKRHHGEGPFPAQKTERFTECPDKPIQIERMLEGEWTSPAGGLKHQVISGLGHQLSLQAVVGPDKGDMQIRVPPSQFIGEAQPRIEVATRPPPGQHQVI